MNSNQNDSKRKSSGNDSSQPSSDEIIERIVKTLEMCGLSTDPYVRGMILNARSTGNASSLQHLVQTQEHQIRAGITVAQFESESAKLNAFHPLPKESDFNGELPIAHIFDHVTKSYPTHFKITNRNILYHIAVYGSSGQGKTVATNCFIYHLLKTFKESVRVWIFEPKSKYRHYFCPEFVALQFRDFRDEMFDPPIMPIINQDRFLNEWLNLAIEILAAEAYVQVGSKSELLDSLENLKRNKKELSYSNILSFLEFRRIKSKDFRDRQSISTLINRFKTLVNFDLYSRNVKIPFDVLADSNIIFETGTEISEIALFRTALLLLKLYTFRKTLIDQDGHVRIPFHVIVIEEARSLFARRKTDFGEPILERIFTLAREIGIGFVVITQEPDSISTVVRSNVGLQIAFPVSDGSQSRIISQSLSLSPEQIDFYNKMSAYGPGHALVRYNNFVRPFPVYFPNIGNPDHYYTNQEIDLLKNKFLEPFTLGEQSGEPEPIQTEPKPVEIDLPPVARQMLETLAESPFLNSSELYRACNILPTEDVYRFFLIKEGFVTVETIKVNLRGAPSKYLDLTEKAYQLGFRRTYSGKESFKHRLFKHLISECLESQSFVCSLEGKTCTGHKTDVLASNGDEKIAFEVTLTESNLESNIEENFKDPSITRVVIVCDSKQSLDQLLVKTMELRAKFDSKLQFKLIFAFTDKTKSWEDK